MMSMGIGVDPYCFGDLVSKTQKVDGCSERTIAFFLTLLVAFFFAFSSFDRTWSCRASQRVLDTQSGAVRARKLCTDFATGTTVSSRDRTTLGLNRSLHNVSPLILPRTSSPELQEALAAFEFLARLR